MIEKFTIKSKEKINLNDFDPEYTDQLSKDSIKEEHLKLQTKFEELQDVLYASKKFALLIVLQGMDCSGKDGTVKKALMGVNPNGFNVESFKEPTPEELGHDYLWRVHKAAPQKGDITVFNRSYYEDVLVTRVHKIIDDETALNRFTQINKFEKYLVDNHTVVIKFFLHISKDFQKKKLESRLEIPEKHWKFSAADLTERKFWDKYQQYYEDVLYNCSTEEAPWHIVPSNNRWFRDYFVLKTIVNNLEKLNLNYPEIDGNIQDLIKQVKDSD
nr:PPK2 family polyphosphate kinase [Clostridium pasteurianum]